MLPTSLGAYRAVTTGSTFWAQVMHRSSACIIKFSPHSRRLCMGQQHVLFEKPHVNKKVKQFTNLKLVRNMAGHSKWQNIKHTKAAKDAAKSTLIQRTCQQMRVAIRDAKSADPRVNMRLAQLIEQAKQKCIPNATIENVLKTALASKEVLEPLTLEVKGPGGCFLLVEALSENPKRTRMSMRTIMNKTGCTLVDGSVKHLFEYKGIINVQPNDKITLDKAVEDAIEAGAADVKEIDNEDGTSKLIQFLVEPADFYNVQKNIENLKYEVVSSALQYLPNVRQKITEADMVVAGKLYDLLENMPEIVNIYDNIE